MHHPLLSSPVNNSPSYSFGLKEFPKNLQENIAPLANNPTQ
jgi:hypothetical protein